MDQGDLLKKKIKITDLGHRESLGWVYGLAEARVAIEDAIKEMPKLPGLHLALSLVEAKLNERKAGLAVRNYRLAAREGVDVTQFAISGIQRGGVVVLEPAVTTEDDDGYDDLP
jgi:hypothetical protein